MEALELRVADRRELYRKIAFVQYRKPVVPQYPPNAIVLNPQHRRLQQQQFQAQNTSGSGQALAEQGAEEGGYDEDDPRRRPEDAVTPANYVDTQVRMEWQSVGPKCSGLVNAGNTCFVNCVLQLIAHTTPLAQYLLTVRTANTSPGAPYDFAHALAVVVQQVHQGNRQPVTPTGILQGLRILSKTYRVGRQSCAHEFLQRLLDGCQNALLHRLSKGQKISFRGSLTTPLFRIISGYLRSQVSWSTDEEVKALSRAGRSQEAEDLRMTPGASRQMQHSNTYDPFTVLNLPLVGKTLQQCLAVFFAPEALPPRCYITPRKVKVSAKKQFLFHVLPPVLLLHLKRFSATGSKLPRPVTFPEVLDVREFCTRPEPNSTYVLNGVAVHEGPTATYGHYVSFCRARNKAWCYCDDDVVRICSIDQVLRAQAYILVYTKQSAAASKTVTAPASTRPPPKPVEQPLMSTNMADLGIELEPAAACTLLKKAKRAVPKEKHSDPVPVVPPEPVEVTAEGDGRVAVDQYDPVTEQAVADAPSSVDQGSNAAVVPRRRPNRPGRIVVTRKVAAAMEGTVQGAAVLQAVVSAQPHTTLQRKKHLPRFRRQVRDENWEAEMDRGRVKKIRRREAASTEDGTNPFQAAAANKALHVAESKGGRAMYHN